MLKKIVFLLFVSVSAVHADEAPHYDTCSICIDKNVDDEKGGWFENDTRQECERWIKRVAPAAHTMIYRRSEVNAGLANAHFAQCDELKIYSAFDGNKGQVELPFQFSQILASAYQAKSVIYTGSTCSVFQKTNQLQELGKNLSQALPEVRFEISGNQREGRIISVPGVFRPREMKSDSSKATVMIDQGKVSVGFEACSKPGKVCEVEEDAEANSKYCTDISGLVKKQTCVSHKVGFFRGKTLGFNGVWSDPT